MCHFHTCEPTLGDQHGGRPAICQNQHRDSLGLVAFSSLPFCSSSFSPLFFCWFFLLSPQFVWFWLCLFQWNLISKFAAWAFCFKKHGSRCFVCFHMLPSLQQRQLLTLSTSKAFLPPSLVLFRDYLVLNYKRTQVKVSLFCWYRFGLVCSPRVAHYTQCCCCCA